MATDGGSIQDDAADNENCSPKVPPVGEGTIQNDAAVNENRSSKVPAVGEGTIQDDAVNNENCSSKVPPVGEGTIQDNGGVDNENRSSKVPAVGGGTIQDDGADNENRSSIVPPVGGGTLAGDDNTFLNLNRLDIQGYDAGSQSRPISNKGRISGAFGEDKVEISLRQLSMKVCEKVQSKGRTTYSEVANELIHEYSDPSQDITPEQQQNYNKNIRRRVYDTLNVLNGMDIISKDTKKIQWKGLPGVKAESLEQIRRRIKNKTAHVQELKEELIGVRNILYRNELYCGKKNIPDGVPLPFFLIQIRSHVDVKISEDMQLVHINTNSNDYEIHDQINVLRAIKKYEDEVLWKVNYKEGGEASSSVQAAACS